MSGFGAMNSMKQMLKNNSNVLRSRKPLEILKEYATHKKSEPLIYNKASKFYLISLRNKLKKDELKFKVKAYSIPTISFILFCISYYKFCL